MTYHGSFTFGARFEKNVLANDEISFVHSIVDNGILYSRRIFAVTKQLIHFRILQVSIVSCERVVVYFEALIYIKDWFYIKQHRKKPRWRWYFPIS